MVSTEIQKQKNNRIIKELLLILFFTFIPVIIYGVRQGFYWDDWSQLLLHEKFGDASFWEYFSYDRPSSAWTHVIFFKICGSSPIMWHILFGLIRFAGITFTYLVFGEMFPNSHKIPLSASILISICPLFSQHEISIAYSQHFLDYFLYIVSFYFLIKAVKQNMTRYKVLFYLLSAFFTILHLSITEYFAFLDLLKLFTMQFFCKKRVNFTDEVIVISQTMIIFIAYVIIRLTISKWAPNFDANKAEILSLLNKNVFTAASTFIKNLSYDMTWMLKGFWSGVFSLRSKYLLSPSNLIVNLISVIFMTAVIVFFKKVPAVEEEAQLNVSGIIFSFSWILAGLLPFLAMNENYLQNGDVYHADRCFLAALPGFCLLLTIFVNELFKGSNKYCFAISILVYLFASTMLKDYQEAIYEKQKQQNFYWQISERIPSLKEKAALVSDEPIFAEQGNFSTSSALNIIYADKEASPEDKLPVWVFGNYNKSYSEENSTFSVKKRNYKFMSQNSIYVLPENRFGNCVWVLTADDIKDPHLSEIQKTWAAATNTNVIDSDWNESYVNEHVFGEKPDSWCMYYQKASLLRQNKNWDGISALYDEVIAKGYSPYDTRSNSPFEWVPFIIGLKHTDRIGEMEDAMTKAINTDFAYNQWFTEIRETGNN